MQWHRTDKFYTLAGYRSPAQVCSQGEKHHTHVKNKTKKALQTHHYSNQKKRKWKNLPISILECPSEEVVFISTGYTSIHQMVRCVYTKANVWCKPQGKQQRLGKEKSPTSVSPCTVSSELLPADSSGEHGIQVTAPGDGGWTADRILLPLWWEAQWCCRHRTVGWTDRRMA